jgi:hypothetical protein
MAGIDIYRSALRSAVRGLWSGVLDYHEYWDMMDTAVREGLARAWYEGARECGVAPEDLSPEEKTALESAILAERSHIDKLGYVIKANNKASGEKLAQFFTRLNLWENRYRDLRNRARVMACADAPLEWVMGPTEKHCRTCPRLNGRVKRASYWKRLGLEPQHPPNPNIECGGWGCLCELKPTDKPVSKGPLPAFP